MTVSSKIVSSLVKVFANENPGSPRECNTLTALRGDTASFQVVYCSDTALNATLAVESPFGDAVVVRSVESVPLGFCGDPALIAKDGNYLYLNKKEVPDYLRTLPEGKLRLRKNRYRAVRIDVEVPAGFPAGDAEITIRLCDKTGETIAENRQIVTVCAADLPDATLMHTEWFHTDCIADYYGYDVFSEEHWESIEKFMRVAAKRGINMILTPVFTPPLDTAVGGERTTVQLADVYRNNGKWSFGFERLERWVKTAERAGIRYFEINHFFTQWGSAAAPKIMATVDGEYRRVFGWDTPVSDGVYPEFLSEFLPALTEELRRIGIADRCRFHVSDEPTPKNADQYLRAKSFIAPYLKGFPLMDALSHYEMYENGTCENPVCCIDMIEPFLSHEVPNLWAYYCCSGAVAVSNRFLAMPLARTRAIGVQLFKFRIKGFLQWGFNFYNSRNSVRHIDPYMINDAGGGFPAGDSFVVYPGPDGAPEESIRLMAFFEAEQDLRALNALEALTSHEYVVSFIEEGLSEPITFDAYPESDFYYINLRNRVNRELEKRTAKH